MSGSLVPKKDLIPKENPPRKMAASFPGPDLLHAFGSVGRCAHVSDEPDVGWRGVWGRGLPTLLLHGSLDLATPIKIADELLKSFPHGHLITVKGGTHAAMRHAASADLTFLDRLTNFLDAHDPAAKLEKMPTVISLPPLRVEDPPGRSLFEELEPGLRREAAGR